MTKPVRVVIAEDEAIIRLDLKEILEEEGYDVVGETGRGDQAIELVRELNPDLAILDIKMPGMDGLTAARTIAGERLAAVLILTAFSQHDLVEQARDAGALAYLVKPFQKSDLMPAIEMALGRFEQIVALEHENADLAERLEARKMIDRAKGRLMDEHGMSEADSWRFLQKTAMDTPPQDPRRREPTSSAASSPRNASRFEGPRDAVETVRVAVADDVAGAGVAKCVPITSTSRSACSARNARRVASACAASSSNVRRPRRPRALRRVVHQVAGDDGFFARRTRCARSRGRVSGPASGSA